MLDKNFSKSGFDRRPCISHGYNIWQQFSGNGIKSHTESRLLKQ